MLAIRAARVVDGTGAPPIEDALLIIDSGQLQAVGPAIEVATPSAAELLDLPDHTILPGLIDVHVHIHADGDATAMHAFAMDQMTQTQGALALRAYANGLKTLRMGFTSLRSVASPAYVDVALRDAIEAGTVSGPRLQVSGQGLTITGGHMDGRIWAPEVELAGRTGICNGPWACRAAAREQIKRHVDLIKINAAVSNYSTDYSTVLPFHQEMTYEEMAAICEEARWSGLRVAAHAHGGEGISDAIRAGVDSIEHAPWLTDEQLDAMVERDVFYVPTLAVHTALQNLGQKQIGMPDAAWNWLQKVCDDRWDTLQRAKEAGVQIAAGTDAGFFVPHGANARELADLVRGGFTPLEAIEAATRTAAACMGWDDRLGTLETGKIADLVVVAGNPVEDIGILCEPTCIQQVYQDGKLIQHASPPPHGPSLAS